MQIFFDIRRGLDCTRHRTHFPVLPTNLITQKSSSQESVFLMSA
jgi:hypothetical protein